MYICDSRGVRDIYDTDGSNAIAASEPLVVLVCQPIHQVDTIWVFMLEQVELREQASWLRGGFSWGDPYNFS